MLGSVRDIISSTGSLQVHEDFNAWGKPAATYADRFGFTGRPLDMNTGLQNNRARWYDPGTSRWTTQDPTEFQAGDANLYRYTLNSSVNLVDPSGEVAIVTLLIVSGLVFFAGTLGHVQAPAQGDPVFPGDQNVIGDAMRFTPAGRGGAGLITLNGRAWRGAAWGAGFDAARQGAGNLDDLLNGQDPRGFNPWEFGEVTLTGGGLGDLHATNPRVVTYPLMAGGAYSGVNNMANGRPFTGAVDLAGTGLLGWNSRNLIQRDMNRLRLGFGPFAPNPLPALPANSLTPQEAAQVQAIADRYNTTIDIVGSRAAGRGRNIETDLTVGRDPIDAPGTTRSDIDFRIDHTHPQVEQLIADLQQVGSGAGRAGVQWSTNTAGGLGRPSYPPFIRFTPRPRAGGS